MRNVIVIGNGDDPNIRETAASLSDWIEQHCRLVDVDLSSELDFSDVEPDVVITLGGDGAVLRAIRRMGDHQVPIIGVNLGKLGFLTTLESDELRSRLPDLLSDPDPDIHSRLRLTSRLVRSGDTVHRYEALNDLVVTRGGISRMLSLEVRIDGERTTTYDGDGIVVSTPTGSTAHNLSAGGPVIEPSVGACVITPLAAHTLTLRPLVVSDHHTMELLVRSTPEEAVLTVDGQQFTQLNEQDRLRIRKSDHPARLVKPPDRSFYHTLNQKLQWGRTPTDHSKK